MLKRRRESLSQKEIMDQSEVDFNHDGKADFRGNTEIRMIIALRCMLREKNGDALKLRKYNKINAAFTTNIFGLLRYF